MSSLFRFTALAFPVVLAGNALAADSVLKCQASKAKTAGAYYSCRQKADASAIIKSVSPDYSKCTTKFDEKWTGAETTGAGACPDNVLTAPMNSYLADQATQAAQIVAGLADIPACGDDSVNVAGELCDGVDLGGASCMTLGYAGGSLACDVSCGFDVSGCTVAGPPSLDGRWIWLLGAEGANCDDTCASWNLVYDTATSSYAGSTGTDAHCQQALDSIGAPGTGLDLPSLVHFLGIGCAISGEERARIASPATTSSDAVVGVRRLCACH